MGGPEKVQTQNFFFETSHRRAKEKTTGHLGNLISATQIRIKGDHTEGPVPVEVSYLVRFVYDKPLQNESGEITQKEESFDRVVPRDDWRQENFETVKKRKWLF